MVRIDSYQILGAVSRLDLLKVDLASGQRELLQHKVDIGLGGPYAGPLAEHLSVFVLNRFDQFLVEPLEGFLFCVCDFR